MILADIASGEVDLADICFLVAVILAGVVVVLSVMARSVTGVLSAGAMGFVAFGLLLL